MIRNTVVPNVALVTFLVVLIVSVTVSAQVVRTDSVNLVSLASTSVTKVVSKTDRTQRLAVAWQTYNADSSRLYFRLYSEKGTPIAKAHYLARAVTKIGRVVMDFDVAIRNNGEAVIAWSEFVPATNKFNLKFCLFDITGKVKGAPQNIAVGTMPYIKADVNSSGGFLIAWDDIWQNGSMLLQIFTEQGVAEGAPLQLYNNRLTAQAGVVEYTDEKRIYVGLMFKDQYSAPSAIIHGYDHLGSALNNPPSSSNAWSLATGDVSFGNKKTLVSFTYNSATYFTMTSKVSASTMANRILVDNVGAQLSQVAQNDNGSIGMAWSTATEVKMGIFHSSGHKTDVPTVVPSGGLTPSSIDIMPGANSEASVVVAANGIMGAQITLQRFRYQGPSETEEQVVNDVVVPRGKVQNALSGVRTHVALWQHKEPTRSAIFAQVYDSLFQKKGSPINVTGFVTHGALYDSYLFDFEAAIDSVGNFMVVWQTNNKDIRATQFNPNGSLKLPEFKVNTSTDDIRMSARIAASPNGKFVIFWRDTGGKVKARLFDKDADSGEKILKEYVWYGEFDAEMRRKNRVAINNRGEFVCTFRTDYYAVQMLIFDASFTEVAAPLHSNLMYSDSNMDIVMNDNQVVLSWAVSGYETGIKVQRFNTRGVKIGTLITADDHVDYLRYPGLAMNYKNEFVLAYQDGTQQLQRFSSQGTMNGERRRFTTLGEIPEVKVSQSPRGDVFAVYANDAYAVPGTTSGGYNVVAKGLFSASVAPKIYYVTRTINEGESFDFGNDKLIIAGRYSHLYGIDSLVVLTLKVIDQLPPSIPTWHPVVSGDKFVRLLWSPNPEPDFKEYVLYRNTVDVSATAQPLATVSTNTYQDNAIDYGQRYFYWLVAVDSYNHASPFSTSVNGLAMNTPPAQPKWSFCVSGDKFIELTWQPNTESDLKYYRLYRNTTSNAATAQLIATQAATTYLDVQVNYGSVYYYWLVAVDTNDGASVFSTVQSATPKNDPPATPTHIVFTRVNDIVTMTWQSNTEPDFREYRVYRTATSDWYSATLIGSPITNTITFAAIPNVTSYYWIFAVDQGSTFSSISVVSSDAIIPVVKKNQQITFNSLPSKSLNEGNFVLEATATSGLPVSYSLSNNIVATVSGNMVTLLSAGTVDITATQAGDGEYNAAIVVVQTLVVKRSQTITFNELPTGLVTGTSLTLQASTSSGLPVLFSISDPSVATIVNNVMTIVGEGSAEITAVQPGNYQFGVAPPVKRKLVVKRSQTITFEAISQPLAAGSSITLQATASSGLPVTFLVSNSIVATVDGNVMTLHAEGTTYITATQPGNDEYNASGGHAQKLVIKRAQTINFDGIPAVVSVGESFTLRAIASSGLTITYKTSNGAVARIENNVLTAVDQGVVTITATQPGNDTFAAAEPVSRTITVTLVTASESPIRENAASLYPNPAANHITVMLGDFSRGLLVDIRIIDVNGKMIHESTVPGNEKATLDVEDLIPGLYYIQLKQDALHAERKFVKH